MIGGHPWFAATLELSGRLPGRSIALPTVRQAIATRTANPAALRRRSPPAFFALVFVLSVPFWLLGARINREVFAGIPITAVMVICPVIAASLLAYQEDKAAGVAGLVKRCFDYRRIRPLAWYMPILLLMPAVAILTFALMRGLQMSVPAPRVSLLVAAILFIIFFLGSLGEEAGWMGYAIDPMQERWGALPAGILLGLVWSAWHLIPLVQIGRTPEWIAWWTLFTVASRVLVVWLYNNTNRSVFAAILFHTLMNLSYALFPIDGSHFDYQIAGLITAIVATIVTVVWGPRTLAHARPR